ncbi:ubiquinol-cytochrome c reductase cytochrome b subunit, partial [Micrococcus sp. SIMBA_144]
AIRARNGKVGALEKGRSGRLRMSYPDRVGPASREELVEARSHGQHGHEDGGHHELVAVPSSHSPKLGG